MLSKNILEPKNSGTFECRDNGTSSDHTLHPAQQLGSNGQHSQDSCRSPPPDNNCRGPGGQGAGAEHQHRKPERGMGAHQRRRRRSGPDGVKGGSGGRGPGADVGGGEGGQQQQPWPQPSSSVSSWDVTRSSRRASNAARQQRNR